MRTIDSVGIAALMFVSGLALGLVMPWPAPVPLPVAALEPTTMLQPTAIPTATSYCQPEIDLYAKSNIAPIMIEWDNAFSVARRTTKRSLPTEIEKLQQIQQRLASATVTVCTNRIHKSFTEATTDVIDGFSAFLRDDPADKVEQHFTRAESALREVRLILGN